MGNAPEFFQINEKPIQDAINDTDSFPLQQSDDETKRAFASSIWSYVASKLGTISRVVDHKYLTSIGQKTHDQIDDFINTAPNTWATFAQGAKADSALQPDSDGSQLVNMTKDQVGLDQVNNTSDINKPISTAVQSALDKKENNLVATTSYYIDGNRSDTYVPNGTVANPYKTIEDAIEVIGLSSGKFVLILSPSSYLSESAISITNASVIIAGNKSTLTANIGIGNGSVQILDLNIIGSISVSGSAIFDRCHVSGSVYASGSISINNSVIEGDLISGTEANSNIAIYNSTLVSRVSSYGFIEIKNSSLVVGVGDNTDTIESFSGGWCSVTDSIIVNSGSGIGIRCDNGSTGLSGNKRYNIIVGNSITTASGDCVSCGNSVTYVGKNLLLGGSLTGSGLSPFSKDFIGSSKIILGSDATGDTYYRGSTGDLTRVPIGSSGQMIYSDGTKPVWADAPTNITGLKFIVQTADSKIPNAQNLSSLQTGVLKSESVTGTLSIATCDDLADGVDYHLITTADKTLLSNTSGVNTGDQTNIAGNAATATLADAAKKLNTSRKINGVDFDGTSDITVSPPIEMSLLNLKQDGEAAIGTSGNIVYSDHVHPTDISRQQSSASLSALAGLTWLSGSPLIRMTAANTFVLDDSVSLSKTDIIKYALILG